MAARPDTSLASLLLTQRLVDAQIAPLKASEYWTVLEAADDLGRLLGLDAGALADLTGLDPDLAERTASLLKGAAAVAFALEEAERGGLCVVTPVDDDYPDVLRQRLGRAAPPILYVVGPADLLAVEGFGIVGSRDVPPAGASAARAASEEATQRGYVVVSGGAKGVDRLAMGAALEGDGRAVGVLAESLMRTVRDPDVRRAIGDGRLCLCTPYKPTAGFSVANAMGRNKVIYALSEATLVVASDHDKGGTWSGAAEALRKHIGHVLVWMGDGRGPGNEHLVELGARPISEIEELFVPGEAGPRPPADQGDQLALDV